MVKSNLDGDEADTVHGRIADVQTRTDPVRLAASLLLVAAIGFTLLVLQEPLVHDSLHNFRHAAGVVGH